MKRICIVGGGPAGLAASIALAQAGFSSTVFEAATPPVDKACGEGLLPDSLSALRQLGVEPPPEQTFRFTGIRFSDENCTATARFPQGHALGIRRTVLHTLLVHRAVRLGVDLRWGTRYTGQEPCDLLIGADGGRSQIRHQAGLEESSPAPFRFGFRQHFAIAPWSDCVEVHWRGRSQIYVTPVANNQVGVAVVSSEPKLRLWEAFGAFPAVRQRLRAAKPLSTERGGLSVMRRLKQVQNGRVALVGDAAGSVDVITGEGLGLAFQQALALARSVQVGDLEQYTRSHKLIARRPRMMAHLLLSLASRPPLRRNAFRICSAFPPIFSSLLAFHVGSDHADS